MFQFRVAADISIFDGEGYITALRKYIEIQVENGAKKFAEAAIARIPIRTGFVAGAFGTLTDLLGVQARFNPLVVAHREYYYGGGGRMLKSPLTGRLFATPGEQVFQWEGSTFVFRYDVDITYFRIQDTGSGPSPTAPWQAFRAGEVAFMEYFNKIAIPNFPKPDDFITTKQIRV